MLTMCLLIYALLLTHSVANPTETVEQTTEMIELHTSVHEERPVGQVIMRLSEEINRYDRQGERKSHQPATHIQFHLLPTHDAHLFFINSDGSLINSKRLDYEELCDSTRLSAIPSHFIHSSSSPTNQLVAHSTTCQLQLRLLVLQIAQSDLSSPSQRQLRTVSVKITLLDTNDNKPTCTLQLPRKSGSSNFAGGLDVIDLPENAIPGTVIAVWKLNDRDTRANGITDARLLGTKNGKSAILSSELPFHLQFDQVMGPWSTVELKLVLTKSVEYLEEPGSTNPSTGSDSDDLDVYNLRIIILDSKDQGSGVQWNSNAIGLNGVVSCNVQVRILDINDHSPTWISPASFVNGQPLELELLESKSYSQRELVRLKATDADRGPNARIIYTWATNKNRSHDNVNALSAESHQEIVSRLFYLDASSGSLQLRGTTVDFEAVSRLFRRLHDSTLPPGRIAIPLQIVALDQPVNQTEQRSSTVGLITIWLIDVNDNSPQIQIIGLHAPAGDLIGVQGFQTNTIPNYPQIVYITENLPANEPVAFITVTDEDSDTHGVIVCALQESVPSVPGAHRLSTSEAFQLIKLNQQTDLEPSDPYSIPREGLREYTRTVNYKLITMRSLDREQTRSFRLNITCTDGRIGSVPTTVDALTSYRIVEVIVSDVNDNAPRIVGALDRLSGKQERHTKQPNSLICSVREHEAPGTKICQLRAEDPDQLVVDGNRHGENAFEWWLEESARPLVDVERETGWLIVQQAPGSKTASTTNTGQSIDLDRETVSEISFIAYVRDGPKSGTDKRLTASATILLRVLDINDHVPKIPEYNHFQVSESAAPGTVIGTLVAVDADQPDTPNSALRYHIYSHAEHMEHTGQPSDLRDSAQLSRFTGEMLSSEFGDIKLDEKSGTLLVGSNGLDRERVAFYKFVVAVSDGAAVGKIPALSPRERHTVRTVVHITVEDENDNIPRIIYPESHTATFTLACSILRQQLPHTIAQIVVNDSDIGINSEVFYYLSPLSRSNSTPLSAPKSPMKASGLAENETSSSNFVTHLNETGFDVPRDGVVYSTTLMPFQIDPQNGLLMIVNPPEDENHVDVCSPDRVQKGLSALAEYRFRVVVTDRGLPPLSSSVIIVVRIVPHLPQVPASSPTAQTDHLQKHLMERLNSRMHAPGLHTSASRQGDTSSHGPGNSHMSASSGSSRDQRAGQQSTMLSSLSSPDVFWAATICLTVATGVLIFLIVLITMVTCHRRLKPPIVESETRQNEWAQADEVHYDPQFSQRPFDNVEMSASKNSSVVPEELFTLNDDSSTNYYHWSSRMKSSTSIPRNSPPNLNTVGYSTLMPGTPHCRTLQNPSTVPSDMQRADSFPNSTSQNPSTCASYEGYQKLLQSPLTGSLLKESLGKTRLTRPKYDVSRPCETSGLSYAGVNASACVLKGGRSQSITCCTDDLGKAFVPHELHGETATMLEDLVHRHGNSDTENARKSSSNKKKNEVSFV